MKRIILATLVLITCLQSFSQQAKSITHFSVLIGPSFPTGKYANNSELSNNLGPANTGEFLKLLVSHNPTSRFGISAQLQFQRNALNGASLKQDLNSGGFYTGSTIWFGTYPPPPPPPVPQRNWTVNNSSWYVASLMIGGTDNFPLSRDEKWSTFVGAQLGISYATTPKIDAKSVTDTLQIAVHQDSYSTFGFTYALNTGINYQLNGKIGLSLHCDYFATSKLKYNQVKTNSIGLQPGSMNTEWVSQVSRNISEAISSVNVGIGLSFSL